MTIVIESQSIAPSHRNVRGGPVVRPGRKHHEWYLSFDTTTEDRREPAAGIESQMVSVGTEVHQRVRVSPSAFAII